MKLLSIFLNDLGSSGRNFGIRNARKSTKGSKDSYSSLESNQILSHNFGWLFGQWRHKKITRTYPHPDDTHRKPGTQISKVFFSVHTTKHQESFEGSNSSLSCSRGELLLFVRATSGRLMLFLQFSDFGVKWVFWAITLVPDMLEGQSRAL